MSQRQTKKSKVAELKANAPSVPAMTCPKIDEVIHLLDTMQSYVETGRYDCYESVDTLLRAYLEHIRFANSQLRESGRYWYQATCDILSIKEIFEDDRF